MTDQLHPHSDFDRFPALLQGLAREFGAEGIAGAAAQILNAERADFCWEGRLAELPLGPYGDGISEPDGRRQRVRILGYFRSRYYVATCVVDAERRVEFVLRHRPADSYEAALAGFLNGP